MLTEPGVGRLSFIEFQMPTLVEKPPKGQGWFHDIKYDGYRTQLIIQRVRCRPAHETASTGLTDTAQSSGLRLN